jgi:hypothetical protein
MDKDAGRFSNKERVREPSHSVFYIASSSPGKPLIKETGTKRVP